MRPDVLATDQAAGLRRVFQRVQLSVLPVCVPGRDAASQAWIVHAAAALAERGRRVVLLDAGREFIARSLGLRARLEMRHVLSGECEFDEVLLSAGANLDLLPANRGLEQFVQSGEDPALLFDAFASLNPPAEVLLANGPVSSVAALVPAGREVLFVASPEPESITGVYAAIKSMEQTLPGRTARIAITGVYAAIKAMEQTLPGRTARIAITGVADDEQGSALAARLADALERFLGQRPVFADFVRDGAGLQRGIRGPGADPRFTDEFQRIADSFDHWHVTHHEPSLQG